MTKILLVEDDDNIITTLSEYLATQRYSIDSAKTQKDAMECIDNFSYDLMLLDISLPDGNGFTVCSYAKEKTSLPIIFLSASSDEYSVVTGLDMGADDYISKPFRPRELLSRITNVLRRNSGEQSTLTVENLSIDTVKGTVAKNGTELFLSALEYKLLLVFLSNRGVVLSRQKLLSEIWDVAGDFVNDNTLTVYIKRLRDKIENNPADPTIIKTVRGLGYKVD